MPAHKNDAENSSCHFNPPRWTEYIRSVRNNNHDVLNFQPDPNHYNLIEHRKSRVDRELSKRKTWHQVCDIILDLVELSNRKNVQEDLDSFHLFLSRVPSDKPNCDEIAILFLNILLKDLVQSNIREFVTLTRNQNSEIREYFGKIESGLLNKIEGVAKSLFKKVDFEVRLKLFEALDSCKPSTSEKTESPTNKLFPFGKIKIGQLSSNIQFTSQESSIFNLLSCNEPSSLPSSTNNVTSKEHDDFRALFENAEKCSGIVEPDCSSSKEKPGTSQKSKEIIWDKNYLLNLIGNEDLLLGVINLITTDRSNDAIQENLFDLLGYDKIDLIAKLLEKRGKIITDLNKEEALTRAVRNKINANNSTQSHPVIGVKVQSAEEKYLEKVYRKEERKAGKAGNSLLNSHATNQAEAHVGNSMIDKINKAQYSSTGPGIGGELTVSDLPNVYDTYAEVKKKAGFISGLKIVLPDNLQRKNEKEFEEVHLPPVKAQLPTHISSRELIKISDLNPIAQQVFHGMKTLNRIQSLVFETAFKTNENLLICAPTGAGKTNIALLTVLHCIMQNTQDGEILKDQFKIIYVAPMKALAAEMTTNFSKRLSPLGIQVKELTGDMQLTKSEITNTQMIITTPEKWDVVTRKSTGDVSLTQIVKLLIIDEIHLLHGDRGPVVESLVARTLRLVESSQRMIRLVGLSATLPNYTDVALFLRVNLRVGLFYFDSRFRPVPLGTTFIGVKALSILDQQRQMDDCCYKKVYDMVSKGHQVMVFVHARNATVKTAEILIELAGKKGQLETFSAKNSSESNAEFGKAVKFFEKSRNKKLPDLFQYGFSFHHAGMLRSDRNMVEKMFSDGLIKVLVCTATLAWGVNLPAHAVVIKGTEIYDAKQGSFVDLGILDVLQIFGRAGRPQFDTEGQGIIITTHDKLPHYLSLLTNQFPIESNFIKFLADNLNAEIGLGTVTNINEAIEWLTYTYLFIRMRRNPQQYGMQYVEAMEDPLLTIRRREIIVEAAKKLDKAKMIRFDERSEYFHSTDLGRTSSYFYIKYDTVEIFNEGLNPIMSYDLIIKLISESSEFEQIKVRDDELDELDLLTREYCFHKVWGGSENVHGKVNILIQTYISRGFIKSFSLISDQQYIITNANRICRGFFEIVLRQNNPILASRFLEISKMLDQQLWDNAHPLRQIKTISAEILEKLERKMLTIEKIKVTSADEIGAFISHMRMGPIVKRSAEELPLLEVNAEIQPITRSVLRVKIILEAAFKWNDKVHGNISESFWVWVEDPENNYIYHQEYFIITKRQVLKRESQELIFTIPVQDPLPTQYMIRTISDRFLGSNQSIPVSFRHLILPEEYPPYTDLLNLDPLSIKALKNPKFEHIFSSKSMMFFNPIQTQVFHCLYHTDSNVLIGAPTGSGKTIAAEIAMFRVFSIYPKLKVVYIAPMKALVRERMIDWRDRLERQLGKKIVELTGDVTPDMRAIMGSDVIVTTPEKWDGISRSWQTRSYVQDVCLIIIDEIHLLGQDRGPVLEVIVSRTNYISQHTRRNLRVIGLSTALANAVDVADWLGIKGTLGLYNFRPSVRPVPIQVHIQGFHGKHYCPRMATMNKPTFQSIREHSPSKPTLVFVSSRRQTRLTALDLIAYLAGEGNPKQWLHLDDNEMDQIISNIKEPNLKLTLAFGIGIHHAGLQENDRRTVEELFVNQKIQVLIATATLAWGVNFPAHLVVIKGTEYYDGKTHRYVDMPITDVLQMMGRAGRPQFDDFGVAVVLVHDVKKNFYKKFLYEPFPVESSLLEVLPDHFNAEVVAGTITTTQDALNYLTCTYFFRRLLKNPSYYQLESNDSTMINSHLSGLISKALKTLENASCLVIQEDLRTVEPTSFGRIAAYYYLSHQTMQIFRDRLLPTLNLKDLLTILTDVYEYDQLPVRHNEDNLNEELAKSCPVEVPASTYNSPHTKAHLLFQCHFSRIQLPSSDYYTDLKSVLDQALRILQAMIDTCAERGWLSATISCINLIQMTIQARWLEDDTFLTLPYMDQMAADNLVSKFNVETIPELQEKTKKSSALFEKALLPFLESNQIDLVYKVLHEIPIVNVKLEAHIDGRSLSVPFSKGPSKTWIDLPPGKEITLILNLSRENNFPKDLKAHAHKFPKGKDESWFIILGDIENRDVVALKRAGGIKRKVQSSLGIVTPDYAGRIIYNLYLFCDAYLGIDQQYEICFNITSSVLNEKVES